MQILDSAVVRFAGESGDGIVLAGSQLSGTCCALGNDVFVLPDPAAEIRAPTGSPANVSSLQVHFSSRKAYAEGEAVHVLVAFTPAALGIHVGDLAPGGILIVNSDDFTPEGLREAGYTCNPLDDESLANFRVLQLPLHRLNREALSSLTLSPKEADRCRCLFALGLIYWLFEKPLEPTLHWIREKLGKNPVMLEANTRTLKAGYHFGEATELIQFQYRVPAAPLSSGIHRQVSGIEALTLGLLAAADRIGKPLFFACNPLPPASDLLSRLCERSGDKCFALQAEDDAAAMSMVMGAAFGGSIAASATSGPGLGLAADALGLAVMAELPLVVIHIQRAGPSVGMPTKTEQSDLLQAMNGRNGECPLLIVAPDSPSDCFAATLEAARLATRYMTPAIVLADRYLTCASQSWRVPQVSELPELGVSHPTSGACLSRSDRQARPWILPGTPGLEHCLSGLEKDFNTGEVSFEPVNHERMVRSRQSKIDAIASDIAPLEIDGPVGDCLLVLGWGSTKGTIQAAVEESRRNGLQVAVSHIRHLSPLPANALTALARYPKVLVPEINGGQLRSLLQARSDRAILGFATAQGIPLSVSALTASIARLAD